MRRLDRSAVVILLALLPAGCATTGAGSADDETVEPGAPSAPANGESAGSSSESRSNAESAAPAIGDEATSSARGPDGELLVEDLEIGGGPVVTSDSLVVVRLTGRLADGSEFQRIDEPAGPWPITALVPGLARGLEGMAVGGRRRITIPPSLGYGGRPVSDESTGELVVPPDSTLVYEVELHDVQEPTEPGTTTSPGAPDEKSEPDGGTET